MNPTSLIKARAKAHDFMEKSTVAQKRIEDNPWVKKTGCKETAACRRASMELTNALIEVRRG